MGMKQELFLHLCFTVMSQAEGSRVLLLAVGNWDLNVWVFILKASVRFWVFVCLFAFFPPPSLSGSAGEWDLYGTIWQFSLPLSPSSHWLGEPWVLRKPGGSPRPSQEPLWLQPVVAQRAKEEKETLERALRRGEDNSHFPGRGGLSAAQLFFLKMSERKKKVSRELSPADSTIGVSKIVLRRVIVLSWKHLPGSLGLTNFTNNELHLRNLHVNHKIT